MFAFRLWTAVLAVLILTVGAESQVIYNGKNFSYQQWDRAALEYAHENIALQSVDSIVNSLNAAFVGAVDSHNVGFKLVDSVLTKGGRIIFTYPGKFDFSGISDLEYTDGDENNIDFLVDSFLVAGQSLTAFLDTAGTSPELESRATATINGMMNATASGQYELVLTVTDSNGVVLAGPSFSAPFELFPLGLDSIKVTPEGVDEVEAGDALQFFCACFDSFDNVIACPEKAWSVHGLLGPTGQIDGNGLFTARFTGPFEVICEVDTFADTAGLFFVIASDFHELILNGVPDTIVAGQEFPDSVFIRAQDVYHNLVGSYTGPIWFETSDSAADLVYNLSNSYTLDPDDDGGKKGFSGSSFILNSAGSQRIRVTDGDSSSMWSYVYIQPGEASDFQFSLPDTVIAGQEFDIEISELADASGNLLTGQVEVELIAGGTSPGGQTPTLNPIFVENGGGSASQRLVNAGTVRFRLLFGEVSNLTDQIVVLNAPADHFEFELSSPQIVGVPFTAPASLTAMDQFGNLVTDYNAFEDNVEIIPLATGSVTNGLIDDSLAFVNAVCDLTQFDMAYQGAARFLQFKAESNSGVEGTSQTVEINSSSIEKIFLSTSSAYRGDQFSALVTISNFGSLPLDVDGLALESSQGEMAIDSVVPDIPEEIAGNSSLTFEMFTSVPFTYNTEMTYFSASFTGFYNMQSISDQSDILDSLKILSQQEATYVPGSLTPDTLSRGRNYSLRLELQNLGDAVISLTSESYMRFSSDSDTFTTSLEVPTFLPASGEAVVLFFEENKVSFDMASGKYEIGLYLSGLQGGSNYSEELVLEDSIVLQSPPAIEFVAGSFAPDSVYRGSELLPGLNIENSGEAKFIADLDLSYLELLADGRRIIFDLAEGSEDLNSGVNIMDFEPVRIPSDFPVGTNTISLHLEGSSNQKLVEFDLLLGNDLLSILRQGSIKIISTSNMATNAPYVNQGQQFEIAVSVRNFGQEVLRNIALSLISEGSLIESDTVYIDQLDPEQTDTAIFMVTASENSNPAEIFTSELVVSTGAATGLPGIILNPEDNTAVATIQEPALISTSLGIVSPADALGGVVNVSQEFTLQADFRNSGQAQTDIGMARLLLPDGFSTSDDLQIAFQIGVPNTWKVRAPSEPGEAEIAVDIISPPNDLNSGEFAILEKGADSVDITVRQDLATVLVSSQFQSYDLVYPGQDLSLLELRFTTDSDDPDNQAVLTDLAFDFEDRQNRAIDLNELILSGTVTAGGSDYSGTVNGERLSFDFGESLVFSADNQLTAMLKIVLADDTEIENFFVAIDSSLVEAHDYSFDAVGARLQVRSSGNQAFSISRGFGTTPADFENSVYNYPNPFNPRVEETSIVYYLPVDSDVEISIYTLIGEPVFSTSLDAGNAGGQGGTINRVLWNGLNGESLMVREGVYIAVVKYSGGEARTKIAVVK